MLNGSKTRLQFAFDSNRLTICKPGITSGSVVVLAQAESSAYGSRDSVGKPTGNRCASGLGLDFRLVYWSRQFQYLILPHKMAEMEEEIVGNSAARQYPIFKGKINQLEDQQFIYIYGKRNEWAQYPVNRNWNRSDISSSVHSSHFSPKYG